MEFSIQDEALDVGLSAPQEAHDNADFGLMVIRVRPAPTRFPTIIRYPPLDSTPEGISLLYIVLGVPQGATEW